jgi:hypothetical protein
VRRLRARVTELEAQARQAVLDLSDERDAALARLLAVRAAEYARGETDGYERGQVDGVMEFKAYYHGLVEDFAIECRRWHVCCRACRRAIPGKRRCDRQAGCPRCQVRTRETYAQPHPDDYAGQAAS